ncbi:hypothetical protein V7968_01615 [Nocardia vulneris]|uniref:hypothetical protein n=1 Tax=Nocardia vulneris TaxID=1141657 RepID=UPI0030D5BE70
MNSTLVDIGSSEVDVSPSSLGAAQIDSTPGQVAWAFGDEPKIVPTREPASTCPVASPIGKSQDLDILDIRVVFCRRQRQKATGHRTADPLTWDNHLNELETA